MPINTPKPRDEGRARNSRQEIVAFLEAPTPPHRGTAPEHGDNGTRTPTQNMQTAPSKSRTGTTPHTPTPPDRRTHHSRTQSATKIYAGQNAQRAARTPLREGGQKEAETHTAHRIPSLRKHTSADTNYHSTDSTVGAGRASALPVRPGHPPANDHSIADRQTLRQNETTQK